MKDKIFNMFQSMIDVNEVKSSYKMRRKAKDNPSIHYIISLIDI